MLVLALPVNSLWNSNSVFGQSQGLSLKVKVQFAQWKFVQLDIYLYIHVYRWPVPRLFYRYDLLRSARQGMPGDGLSDVPYRVISTQLYTFYTKIQVDVGNTNWYLLLAFDCVLRFVNLVFLLNALKFMDVLTVRCYHIKK